MTVASLSADGSLALPASPDGTWSRLGGIALSTCVHAAIVGILLLGLSREYEPVGGGGGGGSAGGAGMGGTDVAVIHMPAPISLATARQAALPEPNDVAPEIEPTPAAELLPQPLLADAPALTPSPALLQTFTPSAIERAVEPLEPTPARGPGSAVTALLEVPAAVLPPPSPVSQPAEELVAAMPQASLRAAETPPPEARLAPSELRGFEAPSPVKLQPTSVEEMVEEEPAPGLLAVSEPGEPLEEAGTLHEMLEPVEPVEAQAEHALDLVPTEVTDLERLDDHLAELHPTSDARDLLEAGEAVMPERVEAASLAAPDLQDLPEMSDPQALFAAGPPELEVTTDTQAQPQSAPRDLPPDVPVPEETQLALAPVEAPAEPDETGGLLIPPSKPERRVTLPEVEPRAVADRSPAPTAELQAERSEEARVEQAVAASDQVRQGATLDQGGQGQSARAGGDRKAGNAGAGGQGPQGAGAGPSGAEMNGYAGQLAAWLERHKRYPRGSRRRGEEGTVTLAFTVGSDGRVLDRSIVASSGHERLDSEVLALLERASPLPRPPSGSPQVTLKIGIVFLLN